MRNVKTAISKIDDSRNTRNQCPELGYSSFCKDVEHIRSKEDDLHFKNSISVTECKTARDVLKKNNEVFRRKEYFCEQLERVGGEEGRLLSKFIRAWPMYQSGNEHTSIRKKIQPALASAKMISFLPSLREAFNEQLCANSKAEIAKNSCIRWHHHFFGMSLSDTQVAFGSSRAFSRLIFSNDLAHLTECYESLGFLLQVIESESIPENSIIFEMQKQGIDPLSIVAVLIDAFDPMFKAMVTIQNTINQWSGHKKDLFAFVRHQLAVDPPFEKINRTCTEDPLTLLTVEVGLCNENAIRYGAMPVTFGAGSHSCVGMRLAVDSLCAFAERLRKHQT